MSDQGTPQSDGDKPEREGDPQRQEPPNLRVNRSLFGWILLLAMVVMLFVFLAKSGNQDEERSWPELVNSVESNHVEEVIVQDNELLAKMTEDAPNRPASGQVVVKISPPTKEFYVKELAELKVPFREKPDNQMLKYLLWSILPWVLILGLIWFFLFRSLRGSGGGMGMLGSFGRSRHKVVNREMTNMDLSDVAGVEEAKEEVGEIIEFLRNPKRFQRLGGRIPRGVLLIGEPGCGKTLLAKAIAGEAEVPFFSISGSDFVEMFVGVGASRVRDLFKQAKDNSPCIIFLDEIDAVGRRRGSGFSSGGHDEREQTLNALLVEMDGFDTNDQVIVVAATNRADVLDPALTRPGRFDRQISVPMPDIKGRLEILNVHAKRVKMTPSVDMEKLARGTPMFSGADLAAIINEAAIIATMANKDFVEHEDLEEARDKVRFGRAYKSRRLEEQDRVGTAYHEAGHAIIQKILPDADPLHKVTILPRGHALGATFSLPDRDRYGYGLKYLLATMRVLCGGRIAEEKKTADVTSGAAADIKMATEFARHMVLEWGMSTKLGFVNYGNSGDPRDMFIPEKVYSDDTARVIDGEVKRLTDEAFAATEKLVGEQWEQVCAVAEALLKYETLTDDDVEQLMAGQQLTKPTVSDLIDLEAARPRTTPAPAPEPQPEAGGDAPLPSPA